MGLEIDWSAQLIKVTSPDTDVDAQTLGDFIEDQMASTEGLTQEDILIPEGKIEDPNNPGIFSQIILVFNSPWQVQFWGGSGYTRIFGGKLVGGLAGQVMKATGTAGDITVLESPVDGVTVATGGGGASAEDIADAVWDEALADHSVAGSMGEAIADLDEAKFAGAVWVDAASGSAMGAGTQGDPVLTLAQARAIADANSLRVVRIGGPIALQSLTQAWSGFHIIADGAFLGINPAGFSLEYTRLEGIAITADQVGSFTEMTRCVIGGATGGLGGRAIECRLQQNITFNGGVLDRCINSAVVPVVLKQGTATIAGNQCAGIFTVSNVTSGVHHLEVEGTVVFDSSCTGGTFTLTGRGLFTDNSTGTFSAGLDSDGFHNADDSTAIAGAVWDEALSGHAIAGSTGAAMARILSFAAQDNVLLDGGPGTAEPTYDSAGMMLTGRMRAFDTSANALAATPGAAAPETGELFQETIATVGATPGQADKYTSVRTL